MHIRDFTAICTLSRTFAVEPVEGDKEEAQFWEGIVPNQRQKQKTKNALMNRTDGKCFLIGSPKDPRKKSTTPDWLVCWAIRKWLIGCLISVQNIHALYWALWVISPCYSPPQTQNLKRASWCLCHLPLTRHLVLDSATGNHLNQTANPPPLRDVSFI